MKKLSILLIGLLLVTGFAFADGHVDIDASAAVTFGIDLNDSTTGFYNEGSVDLTVVLYEEADSSTSGDDGLYGEITVEGLVLEVVATDGSASLLALGGDDDDEAPEITAKIVVSPLEIQIYTAPSVSFNNAEGFANEDIAFIGDDADTLAPLGDLDLPDVGLGSDNLDEAATITGLALYGITITADVDPITVDIKLVSDGDFTDETDAGDDNVAVNSENNYAIGADIGVDVDPLDVDLGIFYGWFSDDTIFGLGGNVGVELADVVAGLEVDLGLDLLMAIDPEDPWGIPDGNMALDTALSVVLNVAPENDDEDQSNVAIDVYFAPAWPEQTVVEYNDLDLKISFTEEEDGGLVDMLYAEVGLEFHDLLAGEYPGPGGVDNDLNFVISASGGYDTGDVDPYFGFSYRSDEVTTLNLGVELKEGLTGIDNTSVTLDYQADDLTDVIDDATESNNTGIITVTAEISL